MSDVRAMTPFMVSDIYREAERLNLNRRLRPETIEELDPTGYSVAGAVLLHDKAQGQDAPLHMRAMVMLKLKDANLPVEGVMDIPLDRWERLPTPEDVRNVEKMVDDYMGEKKGTA